MSDRNLFVSGHDIEDFKCPITKLYFLEPVCANDGFFYEKEALQYYLQDGDASPMNPSIPIENYHENVFFSQLVRKFLEKKKIEKDAIYEKGMYKIESKDSLAIDSNITENTEGQGEEYDFSAPENVSLPIRLSLNFNMTATDLARILMPDYEPVLESLD